MTLKDFIQKMKAIKKKGYIKSKRKGPTGIGYTLESVLHLKENNVAFPDLGGVELKTHRSGAQNLITLFTFNNKVWKINPIEAIRKYGSYDKNERKGLYYTMSVKPNSAGLFIEIDETDICMRHVSGEIIAIWDVALLTKRFAQKLPALILVYAFVDERDGIEYFHFNRAQLLKGTTPSILINQLKEENLLVDLRLHDKGSEGARNHGTGFRVKEDKLSLLFKQITDLEI